MNFLKFLAIPFLQNTFWRLLLVLVKQKVRLTSLVRKIRLNNFNINDVTTWETNSCNTQIAQYHTLREECPTKYRVFFWSVFSRIWTEYGDLLRKSPYSVQLCENTDQKNSEIRQVLRSVKK